jgi:hypothetical protein
MTKRIDIPHNGIRHIDSQQNHIQHNEIQHYNIQHNAIQQSSSNLAIILSIITTSVFMLTVMAPRANN